METYAAMLLTQARSDLPTNSRLFLPSMSLPAWRLGTETAFR